MTDTSSSTQHRNSGKACAATGTSLLDLPNELLAIIINQLSLSDLYRLGLVCRRLNVIVLPGYLSGHGVRCPELSIYLQPENLHILPAITASLSVTSTLFLHCTFGVRNLRTDVERLRRLILKLSFVKNVMLDFYLVFSSYSFPYTVRDLEPFLLSSLQRLFEAFLARKCETFTVRCGLNRREPISNQLTPPKRHSWWRNVRRRFRPPIPCAHSESQIRDAYKDLVAPDRRRVQCESLTTFKIRSTMLLIPPLFDWTVNVLVNSSITTLVFESVRLTVQRWDMLFSSITLPSLYQLSIINPDLGSTIAFPTLLNFLERHPIIQVLHCEGLPPPPVQTKKPTRPLPNLEDLEGPSPYIIYFLHPQNPLHNLSRISVLYSPLYGLGDLENVLVAIGRMSQDIVLRISFPADSEECCTWLTAGSKASLSRPERALHCVTILDLASPMCQHFSEHTRELIPAWLSLFPSLVHVNFLIFTLPTMTKRAKIAFVRSIHEASPGIQTIKLELEQHDVATWLAMQPDSPVYPSHIQRVLNLE